jgi:hypothetical protein
MAQMTPQASKVLEKALTLSTQEHGVFIDRLIESLDEDPPEGVEEAWAEEIRRRVGRHPIRQCQNHTGRASAPGARQRIP